MIFILVLIIVLLFNNKVDKHIFYPAFLFNLIWLIILSLHEIVIIFNFIEINDIKLEVKIYITIAVLLFSLGSAIVKLFLIDIVDKKAFFNLKENTIKPRFSNFLMFTSIFGLILYIMKAIDITSVSTGSNFFVNLRTELNYNNKSYGVFGYFVTIGIFNATSRLLVYNKFSNNKFKEKFALIFSYIIAITFCLFSTGRTFFILLIIISIGVLAIKQEISIKKVFKYFAIILLIFVGMGLLLQKGGNINNSIGQNIKSMFDSFLIYFIGPVTAFSKTFDTANSSYFGEHIFRFFYVIFNKIGILKSESSLLVKEYVDVPFKMNVYTMFSDYVMDLGKIGSLILVFFIGFFNTFLFELSKYKSFFIKYLVAILYYPLILSFFQEQYFSLISTWLQFLILALIVLYNSKPIINE